MPRGKSFNPLGGRREQSGEIYNAKGSSRGEEGGKLPTENIRRGRRLSSEKCISTSKAKAKGGTHEKVKGYRTDIRCDLWEHILLGAGGWFWGDHGGQRSQLRGGPRARGRMILKFVGHSQTIGTHIAGWIIDLNKKRFKGIVEGRGGGGGG